MEERQIAVFKLITGEEVVAEYKIDEQFYVLKQPRRIVLQQTGPTTVRPNLVQWMIGNPEGVFPVNSGHVVTVSAEIEESLRKGYIAQTSVIDQSQTNSAKLIGV